jgi:hypothetical protein
MTKIDERRNAGLIPAADFPQRTLNLQRLC